MPLTYARVTDRQELGYAPTGISIESGGRSDDGGVGLGVAAEFHHLPTYSQQPTNSNTYAVVATFIDDAAVQVVVLSGAEPMALPAGHVELSVRPKLDAQTTMAPAEHWRREVSFSQAT